MKVIILNIFDENTAKTYFRGGLKGQGWYHLYQRRFLWKIIKKVQIGKLHYKGKKGGKFQLIESHFVTLHCVKKVFVFFKLSLQTTSHITHINAYNL